ncbi:MAG TPA: hypothetical protein VLW84_03275 [Terriglobales bacterium]|nr:hypothetical protein [Terriglobales bacterium]
MSTFYEKLIGFDEIRFSPRRKLFAAVVLGAGFLTFFLPLIGIDHPVLNRTQWSMFDVISNVYHGTLFPSRTELGSIPIALPIIYLIMLCSFLVICFFRSQNALRFATIAGILLAVRSWYWERTDFERMFHSASGSQAWPHVNLAPLSLSLLGLMSALLYITITDNLDSGFLPKGSPHPEPPRNAQATEILSIEILPPEDKKAPPS